MVHVRAYSRHKERSHGRSRPQKSRREAQALAPSGRRAGHGVLASARLRALPGAGGLCPTQDAPSRLCRGPDAAAAAAGALVSQRPLGQVRRAHVPGRRRRTGDGAETDVVPVPRADLQQGAALVAGASDPLCRVRRLPPQRAFRFAPRHHADARLRAGRRPCVLPRAGRGGRSRVLHRSAGRGLPRSRFSQLRGGAGDAAGGARRRRRDLGLVRGEARRCRAAMRPRL